MEKEERGEAVESAFPGESVRSSKVLRLLREFRLLLELLPTSRERSLSFRKTMPSDAEIETSSLLATLLVELVGWLGVAVEKVREESEGVSVAESVLFVLLLLLEEFER